MACKIMLVVVVAAVAVLTVPAFAADILVGGDQGWGLGVDYDKWVDGNEFIVGDTLVFKYAKGKHTVVEASTARNLAGCSQANSLGSWNSGEDRVALNTSGHRWFFCGVSDHCSQGMRLNFTVLPAVKLSPPSSSSPPRTPGGGLVTAALAAGAVVAAALVF